MYSTGDNNTVFVRVLSDGGKLYRCTNAGGEQYSYIAVDGAEVCSIPTADEKRMIDWYTKNSTIINGKK